MDINVVMPIMLERCSEFRAEYSVSALLL